MVLGFRVLLLGIQPVARFLIQGLYMDSIMLQGFGKGFFRGLRFGFCIWDFPGTLISFRNIRSCRGLGALGRTVRGFRLQSFGVSGVCPSCRASLGLLGGSWVVISRVLSPLIWVTTIVTLIITPSYNYP